MADSQAIPCRLEALKFRKPISETEMLVLLDYYCHPTLKRADFSAQTGIGLSPQVDRNRDNTRSTVLDRPLRSNACFHAPMRRNEQVSKTYSLSTLLADAPALAYAATIVITALLQDWRQI